MTVAMGTERAPTAADRASVLAVDDQPPFLALLRELVGATSHLELIGEAESGERAVAVAAELRPDMVLMDLNMPGVSGLKAAELIQAADPSTLMVLISAIRPDDMPPRAGGCAEAVIWKGVLEPRLLDEIWLRHHPVEG